jgi:hypothetical protein
MRKRFKNVVMVVCLLIGVTNISTVWNAYGKTIANKGMRTFSGSVISLSTADEEKGTKSEIDVTDGMGEKKVFIVTATTTMYGIKSAPLTFDRIRKGDKVKIRYITTKEGIDEAISIRITP